MKGTHVNMIWTTIGLETGVAKGPTSSKNRWGIRFREESKEKGIYLLITLTLTSAEWKRSTAADRNESSAEFSNCQALYSNAEDFHHRFPQKNNCKCINSKTNFCKGTCHDWETVTINSNKSQIICEMVLRPPGFDKITSAQSSINRIIVPQIVLTDSCIR